MASVAELREQIVQNSKGIRRKVILEQMEALTRLYAKADSNKEYQFLNDMDYDRMLIVKDIMCLNNGRILRTLRAVIQASIR